MHKSLIAFKVHKRGVPISRDQTCAKTSFRKPYLHNTKCSGSTTFCPQHQIKKNKNNMSPKQNLLALIANFLFSITTAFMGTANTTAPATNASPTASNTSAVANGTFSEANDPVSVAQTSAQHLLQSG